MLSSMKLGIIGLGRLGKMVAQQALAFRMRVAYYDPSVKRAPRGVKRSRTLVDLVSQSDIVTVHVPLEKASQGLIEEEILSHFKDEAYLINTSRGEIVESHALLACLESGKVAGAALDVLDGEFDRGFQDRVSDHPLVKYARAHDNLLITPHIGGSTVDAWKKTEEHTIRLVLEVLRKG